MKTSLYNQTIKIEFELTQQEHKLMASVHCDTPSGAHVKTILLMNAARLARREIDDILRNHFDAQRKADDEYHSTFTKDLMKGPFGLGKPKRLPPKPKAGYTMAIEDGVVTEIKTERR